MKLGRGFENFLIPLSAETARRLNELQKRSPCLPLSQLKPVIAEVEDDLRHQGHDAKLMAGDTFCPGVWSCSHSVSGDLLFPELAEISVSSTLKNALIEAEVTVFFAAPLAIRTGDFSECDSRRNQALSRDGSDRHLTDYFNIYIDNRLSCFDAYGDEAVTTRHCCGLSRLVSPQLINRDCAKSNRTMSIPAVYVPPVDIFQCFLFDGIIYTDRAVAVLNAIASESIRVARVTVANVTP